MTKPPTRRTHKWLMHHNHCLPNQLLRPKIVRVFVFVWANLTKLLENPLENVRRLPGADIQLCKSLMTQIIDYFTPILFTPAATPHMTCTDVFADTWMPLVISPAIENDGVYKPIETLERMKQIDWASHGLCGACVAEKYEEWSEEQENVWALVEKLLKAESSIIWDCRFMPLLALWSDQSSSQSSH